LLFSVFIHVLDDRFWSGVTVEWSVVGLKFVYINSSIWLKKYA